MMKRLSILKAAWVATVVSSAALWQGCGTDLLPGTVAVPPFAQISFEQRADLPNFTVSFNAENAVLNPDLVTQVNWVFGDGTGFITGGLQIDHRYVSAGRYSVTAYFFDKDGFVDSVTTSINIAIADKATGPSPADTATDVPVNTLLGWTPGNGSTKSALYLGTDLAAVQAGDASVFQGELSQAAFDPVDLNGGSDYYWRVDALNGSTRVTGDVWTFRTAAAPGLITNPMPANAATDVAIDVTLTWTAGANAQTHDIYFGTDPAAVAAATRGSDEFQMNESHAEFTPEDTLDNNTMYFWRVDEVGPGGTTKGIVLQFRTADLPGKITNPSPAHLAVDVRTDAKLMWTAGTSATSHDVYFGNNKAAVETATKTSAQFRGNQEETEFEPVLTANTTFFWRIDEVGPGGTTKGDVLEFTTALAPGIASEFEPEADEIEVPVAPVLRWKAGARVEQHLLFFGRDRDEVSAADEDDETGILLATLDLGTEMFEPGATTPLLMKTDYYWRVDERGPGGLTRGPVLKFTTRDPIRAGIVSPTHRQKDVALDADLVWTAGDQNGPPLSHDVYFGTSRSDVNNANTSSAAFMGSFPVGTLTYDPGALDPDTEYFWRIDERYPVGQGDTEVAKGAVWKFTTLNTAAEKATAPSPANGAMNVDKDSDLSWTAGARADSHDVYFGDDQAAVTAADRNSPLYKGNFTGTSATLPTLDVGQQYYWRVDEVNEVGTTAGDIWSFTVQDVPGQITNPSPADGAVNQNVNLNLTWTAGERAESHDVYFSEDATAVFNADHGSAAFQGNQSETQFDPGTLEPARTYFWRIDEVNTSGTTTGGVFVFTTGPLPAKATSPSPAHNATNVSIEVNLSWTAGLEALSHDVYFGTDQSAVENATPDDPRSVFQGNRSVTNFDPGTLLRDTIYYWRIDEVGTAGTTKGDLWHFRTAPAPTQAQLVAANGDGPANAAGNVSITPTLQWTPGTGVGTISNDVYFGTDFGAVDGATRISPEFKVNQQLNTYAPGALALATRYYWRIDTVDHLGGTTKGGVWQFDTQMAGATATRFVILDPQDVSAGSPTVVTIQAQTGGGALDSSYQQDVTLVASGSAQGAGLVNIINGVGTIAIVDNVAETVTLSLQDTQGTGLDVTSTQQVVFFGPLAAFRVEADGGGNIPDRNVSVPVNYQVTAIDAQGNTVGSFTGTVDITATLPFIGGPTQTSQAFVAGQLVHQSITFTQSGLCILTATETGGVAFGDSNQFQVTP